MGRAGGLTGSGAGLNHVLAVVAVVGVPALRAPFGVVGQLHLRPLNGLFGADLLPELEGIHRAVLNVLSAGYAVARVNLSDIV